MSDEADSLPALAPYFEKCLGAHERVCPRQVLGVRIALAGAAAVGLSVPRSDKRLLVICETDGCFVSGIEAVSGAAVRHRTLRVEDLGRIAATFVDVETGSAVRVAPRPGIRARACSWAPEEKGRWFVMRRAYEVMPDGELLGLERVRLRRPVGEIVSRPHVRTDCVRCGEEVINERELEVAGEILCRACAEEAYYEPLGDA